MNFERLIEVAFSGSQSKLSTLEFLTSYYRAEGYNVFKASELAETNINNFINFVQQHINDAIAYSTCAAFLSIDRHVVSFNCEYPIVQHIKAVLNNLTWQDFELFCGQLLEKCFNAENVKISPQTNDGGVDFSAILPFQSQYSSAPLGNIEIYGQVKKYTNNIGRVEIDKFTAFANRKKRDNQYPSQIFIFCTTSDYSTNACDEIKKNHFSSLNGSQISYLVYNYMRNNGYVGNDYLLEFMK